MFSQALRQARFSLLVHYILFVKELVDHVKNKLNVIGLVLFIPFFIFCAITCCQELLFKVTFLQLLITQITKHNILHVLLFITRKYAITF